MVILDKLWYLIPKFIVHFFDWSLMIFHGETKLSFKQRLLESVLILFCCFSLYLILALATFDMRDASWNTTSELQKTFNQGGRVGAWIADLLLMGWGYVAYMVPFGLSCACWQICKYFMQHNDIDLPDALVRTLGFLLALLSSCGLLSMNAEPFYIYSGGGALGDLSLMLLVPYFNWMGTALILLSLFLMGMTLLTGIGLMTCIDQLGIWVLQLWRGQGFEFKWPQFSLPKWQWPAAWKRQPKAHVEPQTAPPEPEFKPDETREPRLDPIDILLNDLPNQPLQASEASSNEVSAPQVTPAEPIRSIENWNPEAEPELEPLFEAEPEMAATPTFQAEPRPIQVAETEPEAPVFEPEIEIALAPEVAMPIARPETAPSPVLEMPTASLLDAQMKSPQMLSEAELEHLARLVEAKLEDFNIKASVVDVYPGPVITRFELDLAPGIKVSKITTLAKDLARALSAVSVRVVEVIPGKSVIGLELPNIHRDIVSLSEMIESDAFQKHSSHLAMVLGSDIAGDPVVVDLAKMPHLLVAGTTGSGKSVGVNVMILSLLFKSTPEEVRLVMIDPKMLELSVYEGIPHLLCEVITDMKQASNALRWCVGEMERRYQLMSALGVRNLEGYNRKVEAAIAAGQPIMDPLWIITDSFETTPPLLGKLPSIVVVIDEFADMMMIVGKKVEELIARIAQKARAAGIHLILATQRPSVDVITGLIKANVPTRIAFQVSSKIDSRTILDQQGAETLLGMGDMLYLPPGTGMPIRVHGAYVADHEVHRVVTDWKQKSEPQYIDGILTGVSEGQEVLLPGETSEQDSDVDALYDEAVAFVTETRRGSISSVQRKFKIGYNRAARIIESMEQQGVVSAPMNNGNRDVLAPAPVKI
jgi:S-DNA-T family DNA segregation ATPase FtsK/SpoIIIE